MKRRIIILLVSAFICLTFSGCAASQTNDDSTEDTSGQYSTEPGTSGETNHNSTTGKENTMEDKKLSSNGTRVKVTMNDTVVYAVINNTTTGRAFLEKLPFMVSGYRSPVDICCSVSDELPNDPSENQAWHIGEIGWFGGWFTILCENEEQFSNPNFSIIGKFEDAYMETVTTMKGNIDFIVELADDSAGQEENTMYIKIGDITLCAEMADNSSAAALLELLKD